MKSIYAGPEGWRKRLPADHHCFPLESRVAIEARFRAEYRMEHAEYFMAAIKSRGAVLTAFTEADYLTESLKLSAIKTVSHRDVTSDHFVDWFFALEDWVSEPPEHFPYHLITHGDEVNVYGYFNGNQLDSIICVEESDDDYYLSFFCVNKDRQYQGIGQFLFQFVLNRFKDKTLTLTVRKDNAPAIHIYKKYGFTPVWISYEDPASPCYVMQKF
jgi:ribosomal protein S18 acetylase RimI-like enzyme